MEPIHKTRRSRTTRANNEQLQTLLSYMEDHSTFAKSHVTNLGASGHDKYKLMWRNLTKTLNDLGPATKDTLGWENTWKYLRNTAKTKKADYIVAINKTGNTEIVEPLRNFDERITAIFGKHGTGLCVIREVGIIKKPIPIMETETIQEVIMPCHQNIDEDVYCQSSQRKAPLISNVSVDGTNNFMNEIDLNFQVAMDESLTLVKLLKKDRDKKTKNRPTKNQVCKLINYMENHLAFARNQVDDVVSAIAWQQLTPDLNANGLVRDTKTWQKTWADLQRMAEQRMLALNLGTRTMPLSDEDIRVLKIKQPQTVGSKEGRSRSPQEDHKTEDTSQTGFMKSMKCNVIQKTSVTAPTIDLTNELGRVQSVTRARVSTVSATSTPLRHRQSINSLSGSNTSDMIRIMKEHSAQMKSTLDNVLDCFERQNNILKEGFESVATKLTSFVQVKVEDTFDRTVSPKAEIDFDDFNSHGSGGGATYNIRIANMDNERENNEELCFEDLELSEEYAEDDHDTD